MRAWILSLGSFFLVLTLVAPLGAWWAMNAGKPGNFDAHDAGYDCVLVFGAKVWPSGNPSHALYDRTATAAKLALRHNIPCLRLSGGPSDPANTKLPHEVDAMARIARRMGVPRAWIERDTAGLSTHDTLRNLPQNRRYVMVSNDYHLARIRLTSWKQGFGDSVTYPAALHFGPYWRIADFEQREVLALLWYFAFKW